MVKNSKTYRILDIYTDLLKGKSFTTKDRSLKYNVDERSIARDISDLKQFVKDRSFEEGLSYELFFDKKINAYRLEHIKYL